MNRNTRIPTLAPDGTRLMPTKYWRAEAMVEKEEAEWVSNDLNIKAIRLLREPSGYAVQPVTLGVDPGKKFSGIAVQSSQFTLFTAHLVLPFPNVTKKMTGRRILRRTRRGRRINRKVAFKLRAHRQERFYNRRQKKLVPSIRANREFELRIARELMQLFPISSIVYEYIEAKGSKAFSPVMVGQKVMLEWLRQLTPVKTQFGWQTATLRNHLGLVKQKHDKSEQSPQTHAVDGVALASSQFVHYKAFQSGREHGHCWTGSVRLTPSPFRVITRPNIYRRQLHFENFSKGGIRKRKGGTVTPWGLRSGDFVQAEKAGRVYRGWIGGFSQVNNVVSVYDHNWKRIEQFRVSKVQLIKRSTKLCVA
ncbi:RRXRR domain-containing protein [Leptolyngbya sp. FACHB-541]|uniref:RRXRR domain-containing protein n=1 Tax=Leptolyngbya sp. FACHB-541 TaxID=2692810 RepID=UPI0016895220|nr:RRXRR domain-containing protein [Leptolyngbya sp. FACHB-541]MBD1995261.1 RRXRR domain-containing protein [Leptolyngbya sp. FACHB-541]